MDGYEVNNLISSNFLTKARGFVAYSHIKPPTDIEFKLICPIDIHYIKLHTTLGSQKVAGLSLFALHDKCLVEIAKATYEEDGVIFCNSKYYEKFNNLPLNPNKFAIRFLRNNFRYIFTKCSKIVIRILRTNRTVPCLAGVEVWGTISRTCSLDTANTVNYLVNKTNVIQVENKLEEANVNQDFNIPEEFLDSITFELMSLPMTLPSGHNIDQTTLEKCINNDNTYGRQPSDPFTGLKFTQVRRPIFNSALKTRIDMFLIKNSNEEKLFNVKRTLGKKHVLNNTNMDNYITKKVKYECNNEKQCSEAIAVKSTNETSSLDDAINKVLNGENFLRFTVDVVDNNPVKKCCVLCKTDENIYIVPCEHLFCRSCLLKICETLKCTICDKAFLKADVKRFHT